MTNLALPAETSKPRLNSMKFTTTVTVHDTVEIEMQTPCFRKLKDDYGSGYRFFFIEDENKLTAVDTTERFTSIVSGRSTHYGKELAKSEPCTEEEYMEVLTLAFRRITTPSKQQEAA